MGTGILGDRVSSEWKWMSYQLSDVKRSVLILSSDRLESEFHMAGQVGWIPGQGFYIVVLRPNSFSFQFPSLSESISLCPSGCSKVRILFIINSVVE